LAVTGKDFVERPILPENVTDSYTRAVTDTEAAF